MIGLPGAPAQCLVEEVFKPVSALKTRFPATGNLVPVPLPKSRPATPTHVQSIVCGTLGVSGPTAPNPALEAGSNAPDLK